MKLEVSSIEDHGLQDERVILKVLEDGNLDNYILVDTTDFPNGSTNGPTQRSFWFASTQVKKGDLVVVNTKAGEKFATTHADSTTTHFFYWNRPSSLWAPGGATAMLFELNT